MAKIKSMCPKCMHTEYGDWKDEVKKTGILFFTFLGMITLFVGIIMGPWNVYTTLTSAMVTKLGVSESYELREHVLNITTVDGRDSFIMAQQLTRNLHRLRYTPANIYYPIQTPEQTLDYGGDCKAVASLFASMMRSVGYQATVDCDKNHCVTFVPYDGPREQMKSHYVIVDMTYDAFSIYQIGTDFWNGAEPVHHETHKK